jgi:hypothetical protein
MCKYETHPHAFDLHIFHQEHQNEQQYKLMTIYSHTE